MCHVVVSQTRNPWGAGHTPTGQEGTTPDPRSVRVTPQSEARRGTHTDSIPTDLHVVVGVALSTAEVGGWGVTPLARRVSHARESSGLCTFPLNSGTECICFQPPSPDVSECVSHARESSGFVSQNLFADSGLKT